MAVLRGETPDRVPVCLHNFLMAAHEAGIPLERYLSDPEAAARAHLHAVRKYGYDCILIDLPRPITSAASCPLPVTSAAISEDPGRGCLNADSRGAFCPPFCLA